MQNSVYNKHYACTCSIRYKQWSTGQYKPALVCTAHNTYIQWLSEKDAQILHFELGVPITRWVNKKPKKTTTSKTNKIKKHLVNKYVNTYLKKMYSNRV